MKNKILAISLLLIATLTNAQTNAAEAAEKTKSVFTKNLFIGIGGSYSAFQDVKYSNVRYGGIGGAFAIGFNKNTDNYFWETALDLTGSFESGKTHGATAFVMTPLVYFKYLRFITNKFKVGARIDLLEFYFRNNQGLGNNGTYIITGHNFYGSMMYDYGLNEKWNLQSSLDFGLVSFMQESTGFAFSAPQNVLEDGEFDYQNAAISSPFGYGYFNWKYFGNNLNIKTSFLFQYRDRISIGYSWSMRRFASVKSYPVTAGVHSFIFKYNIINKQ